MSAEGTRTSSVNELVIEAVKLTAVEERRRCVSRLVDTGPSTSPKLTWDLQPPVGKKERHDYDGKHPKTKS